MCDLCGQVHADMVKHGTLTVCASKRWCLLEALKTADELQIARLHRLAVETALTAPQRTLERLTA